MPLPMYSAPSKDEDLPPLNGVHHIIAIAAGKGGVGKSFITAYLALALKQQGYRIGILDSDLYGPSMRKMLPEDRMPAQKNGRLIPALTHGISMLSMAYFQKEQEAAGVRAPIANRFIRHFIEGVDWGELDYLLIDFPPGTGDIQLTLGQQLKIDAALLVTTPQEISVLDVRKSATLFKQLHIPILGIVENMSYYREKSSGEAVALFGKGGGEKLAAELEAPLLARIPLDPELGRAADLGRSPFLRDPAQMSESLQTLLDLSKRCIQEIETLDSNQPQLELIWKSMP